MLTPRARAHSISDHEILGNPDTRRQRNAEIHDRLETLAVKAWQNYTVKSRRLEAAKRAILKKEQQFKCRFAVSPPSNHDLHRNSYVQLVTYCRRSLVPGACPDLIDLCMAKKAVLQAAVRKEEAWQTLQARQADRRRARQQLRASDLLTAKFRRGEGDSKTADESEVVGLVPGMQSLRLDNGAAEELCAHLNKASADTAMVV
jgi:Tfp pilus assembly protein PilE